MTYVCTCVLPRSLYAEGGGQLLGVGFLLASWLLGIKFKSPGLYNHDEPIIFFKKYNLGTGEMV